MHKDISIPFIVVLIVGFVFCFASCKKQNTSPEIEMEDEEIIEEPPVLNLAFSPKQGLFGYFQDTVSVYIKNTGDSTFNWSIKDKDDFHYFSIESGTLEAGDSVLMTLIVDRTGLEDGLNIFLPIIQNSDGFEEYLQLRIKHQIEDKWLLEHHITDVEFDKHNDIMVAVSLYEELFLKLNPATQELETLPLNIHPTCVSVSSDGNYAVVGHSGGVVYVNLETVTVEKMYGVPGSTMDIVFADNDWVYTFPDKDNWGWEYMKCLYLPTGFVAPHTGQYIRPKTKAKLHPSGKYIYGADDYSSPTDFEKYDITGGTAQYLYDSPYHSEYNFNGDIWISEDGERLYAASRNIFRATENTNTDITFIQQLPGEMHQRMIWLAESESSPRIYAIYATREIGFPFKHPERVIRKFNLNHELKGEITIPEFLIPDGKGSGEFHPGNGRYCFLNSEGTKLYVVATAEVKDAYEDHWAVVTVDVE